MGLRLTTAIALAISLTVALLAPSAFAKTFKPTTRGDHAPDGCNRQDCTLREAVIDSNARAGKDRIVLRRGKAYKLKQEGAEDAGLTGDLDVTDQLAVKGKPKARVSGGNNDTVFSIPSTAPMAELKLSKLTVTKGSLGGVAATGGTLKLMRMTVSGNTAPGGGTGSGGGVRVGPAATATIKKSTVSGNEAEGGAGIFASGTTTILNSTISGNRSFGTGGGIKSQSASLTVRNSTISGNRTTNDGGGISLASGGTTLNNVTVAGNKADTDGTGGPDVGGGISAGGSVSVSNTLIAENKLGGNPMPPVDVNCDGTFTSGGGNLRGSNDSGCVGFTAATDIVKANPRIGDLSRNGGPTRTIALQRGSAALDAAVAASAEPKDQRGVARVNPDIGAYERR